MSFTQTLNGIPKLKENQDLLATLVSERAVKQERAFELEAALNNMRSNIAAAAENLLAGGDVDSAFDEKAVRAELAKVSYCIKAADVAIPKLQAQIQSQIADAAVKYAKLRQPEQLVRAHKTLDALLDLVSISEQERILRAEAAAEGCPANRFKKFTVAVRGSEMTGHFPTEVRFLKALFEKYEALGLPPTANHWTRLATFADQG